MGPTIFRWRRRSFEGPTFRSARTSGYIRALTRFPLHIAAAAAIVWLLAERPVHAYIDPGTGSLIYQTALTVLLGLGLVVRRSRESIVRFVRRLSGRDTASERTGTGRD